jgi:two-component system, NarL family, response regulator NreC
MKTKILLADDHRLFRDGLHRLLDNSENMTVIAETSDGAETVTVAIEKKPDIILMDITMPVLNGIDAARRIVQENPRIKVIILSMHSDRRFVLEAFRAGALGYLLKDCAFDELTKAIKTVAEDQVYLDGSIARIVVKDFISQSAGKPDSVFAVLSVREREVLQQMAEGQSTKEIAGHLNISAKTVETHRKQIMDKLNIHNIAQLTKYAIREGLTGLE